MEEKQLTLADLVENVDDLKCGWESAYDLTWKFPDGSSLDWQQVELIRAYGNWERASPYRTVKEKKKLNRDLIETKVFHEYTKDSVDSVDYVFNAMYAEKKIKQLREKAIEKEYLDFT